jgi:phage-related protein
MELIQNAYAGFAKQNYTMLDNLKLGYGGTQTEMQRLIKDAAALDNSIDANSMSFANIVKAINVVQTEMGITGTTAKEAGRTIEGSVNAMKAAWTNRVTGIADKNADL